MSLELENARLRDRLAEAEAVIQAIRRGEIDAVVVNSSEGTRIFTLEGSDHPYRLLVESMNEGAATLSEAGIILFSNPRLATLLGGFEPSSVIPRPRGSRSRPGRSRSPAFPSAT